MRPIRRHSREGCIASFEPSSVLDQEDTMRAMTESTSKHILVVEDQADNRQILRDLLGHAGYELAEAESGEDALVAVAEWRPDLILMDLRLPILDGYEVTRRIKSDPTLRSIPIIAVTAYALSGDEGKGQEAGCDAYVTKPYCPRQLLMKIREFLP
jgi:two-component system cell cycle response regulator DivK